jgi:SAM-dependent methyltransferase
LTPALEAGAPLPPAPPESAPGRVAVPRCLLCAGERADTLFVEPPHTVVRCVSCGLVWVTPRFTECSLGAVYDESYWRSVAPRARGYADYRRDQPLYLKTFRRRLAVVRRHVSRPGTLLDVGCAAGFFMQVMRDEGWTVYGVEPSAGIVAHAREQLGLGTIHVGTLDGAPHAPGTFDLVTLWDVIEHVPDPIALLRRARELLRPDGTLILETQDIDSLVARLLGRRWHHFKHDEHLYHFGRSTVRELLARAGLRFVEMAHGAAGKYVSLGFVVERAARVHPALSRLLRALARAEKANLYVNLGDEMIVVARPDRAPTERGRPAT